MKKFFVLFLLVSACDSPPDRHHANQTQRPVENASAVAPCLSDKHKNLALLMGASTEHAAQFNILVPTDATVEATVKRGAKTYAPVAVTEFPFAEQPCRIVRVRFDELSAATDFRLDVAVTRGAARREESRDFRTQNPAAEAFRVAFGTCMNDEPGYHAIQRNLYQALTFQRPDLFIIGGDTVYVDAWAFWPDGYEPGKNVYGGDIWRRYTESWLTLDLYHQNPLTPVIATWDDHDYGQNDADSSFLLASSGNAAFTAFFGSDSVAGKHFVYARSPVGMTVGSSFRAGDELFVLLDNRSERTAKGASQYKHWGVSQEAWLDEAIKDVPRAWIISGNQYRGDHHEKNSLSKEDPVTFSRMLARIEKRPARSVVLLAGDTHMSEVQIYPTPNGTEVLEFTVSPLHSRISDKHLTLNDPNRENRFRRTHPSGVDFGAMQPNFAVFSIAPAVGDYSVTLFGETGDPILAPVSFQAPPAAR